MTAAAHPDRFLRTVLLVDSATCLASGLAMSLGAALIAHLTSIPSGLLLYAGLSLLPIAAFIAFVATRAPLSRGAVWLVVAGNVLWVLASIWLILAASISPNVLGIAYTGMQAAAVALLTCLEYRGVAALADWARN
jgi:hypothetical protein